MKPKIYLCGKISGLPWKHVKGKFNRLEVMAIKMGYEPINPIVFGDFKKTWISQMKECIKKLVDCDAILVGSDWRSSDGAKVEMFIAKKLNIEMIYE